MSPSLQADREQAQGLESGYLFSIHIASAVPQALMVHWLRLPDAQGSSIRPHWPVSPYLVFAKPRQPACSGIDFVPQGFSGSLPCTGLQTMVSSLCGV